MQDLKIERRHWKSIAIVLLTCYGGAFVGQGVFHFVTAGRLGLDLRDPGICLLPFAPVGVIGMAVFTPGANVALLVSVALGVLAYKKKWPWAMTAVLAMGFAVTAYWVLMMWKTG